MKTKLTFCLTALAFLITTSSIAQNTFPSTGRTGINTLSPKATLQVNGSAFIGSNSNYVRIDSTSGNLSFVGNAGYKVANNKFVFSLASAPNAGLFYNTGLNRYQFQNPGSIPVFSIGNNAELFAVSPGLDTSSSLTLGNKDISHVLALYSGRKNYLPTIAWYSGDTLRLATSATEVMRLQNGLVSLSAAIKIVDGTQGAGKVLTSDSNGLARWMPVAATSSAWSLTGNAGTDGANNFLGTTDLKGLRFRTNNKERMKIDTGGSVLINTTIPSAAYKLVVNGKIICTELKVQLPPFPDYVFEKGYKLASFEQLENIITNNHHLPGIASAAEMQTNNMGIGELQTKVVEKVEENVLYILQLNKENQQLKHQVEDLAKALASLQAEVQALKK